METRNEQCKSVILVDFHHKNNDFKGYAQNKPLDLHGENEQHSYTIK